MTHPFDNFPKINTKEFKYSAVKSKNGTKAREKLQRENKDFLKDWMKKK